MSYHYKYLKYKRRYLNLLGGDPTKLVLDRLEGDWTVQNSRNPSAPVNLTFNGNNLSIGSARFRHLGRIENSNLILFEGSELDAVVELNEENGLDLSLQTSGDTGDKLSRHTFMREYQGHYKKQGHHAKKETPLLPQLNGSWTKIGKGSPGPRSISFRNGELLADFDYSYSHMEGNEIVFKGSRGYATVTVSGDFLEFYLIMRMGDYREKVHYGSYKKYKY
jgi:hypothetical protein